MNKISFKTRLFTFFIAIGIVLAIMGGKSAILLFKGDKIVLSESKLSDYHEPKLAEGNIFSIQYIMTGVNDVFPYNLMNKKANFYLILNVSRDEWKNAFETGNMDALDNGFYIIYVVRDEEMIKKCDAAVIESEKYAAALMRGDIDAEIPDIDLKFEGKTVKQPDDSAYISTLNQFLSPSGIGDDRIADLMISDGKVGAPSVALFFGGIALTLAGIICLILPLIKAHIRAKIEE